MTFDFVSLMQVFLTMLGMYFVNTPKLVKYGCLAGLAAQPFWFILAIRSGELGIVITTTLITGLWLKGLYRFWIEPYWIAKKENPLI